MLIICLQIISKLPIKVLSKWDINIHYKIGVEKISQQDFTTTLKWYQPWWLHAVVTN